jgi:hypothetical protein
MQRPAIDKIRQYFPSLSAVGAGKTLPAKGETERESIERKTKAFLAEGGEVEEVETGKSNWKPTIQIVIRQDTDRKRETKRKK